MFIRLTPGWVTMFLTAACAGGPSSGDIAMSEEERAAIVQYGKTVPFVPGEDPLSYGHEDPLVKFSGFPDYAGHWVVPGTPAVFFLYKQGAADVSGLAIALANEACRSDTCREHVSGRETPWSLRELRSIAGWVNRSPVRELGWTTTAGEDGAFVEFNVTADRVATVEELLNASGAPADAWRVKLTRPYEAL